MERLPGFRDFYPEPMPFPEAWSCAARQFLFNRWRETARRYGFQEYDGPPLEPLELFTLKSGAEIVGQLYNFTDKGEREISLRPEMTPTLARMVAAGERHYKKPIKWFSIPQLFRYERQQKGRLREHFQLNADILGENDPAADAELIALLIDTLRACGLEAADFVVRLSHRKVWEDFYLGQGGDPVRASEFYQVIDKLEREKPEEINRKLSALGINRALVDQLIEAAQPNEDLGLILSELQGRGLSEFVELDFRIVRGLAYYTSTVFEVFDRSGEFRAIAGGGRYDHLVELISGGKVRMPALGFGMGDVVLLELLKARNRLPSLAPALQIYLAIEEEEARGPSLRLVQRLRQKGFAVEFSLARTKGDKQFKRALELQAKYLLKLRREDSGPWRCQVKNLQSREESMVDAETDALIPILLF